MEKTTSKLGSTVRERVKALRTERGLTQGELCALAGISLDAVTRIEGGSRVPTLETLEKLAEALQVRVVDLLGPAAARAGAISPAVKRIVALLGRQPLVVQEAAAEQVQAFLKAVGAGRRGR